MFFIVRCIFWLSLVFLNLPDGGPDVSASKFLDMASAHVGSLARSKGESMAHKAGETLLARVADDGAEWCQTHGEACADAVLAAMVSKSSPASAPAATDTLTPTDRASRWHGPRRS